MNERNVFDDERIENLRRIAISLIKNYIGSVYGEKDGIQEELDRIENELSNVEFTKTNRVAGSPTRASNDKEGHINFNFQNIDNISDAEIDDLLETVVHEFYHSVSKNMSMSNVFLEEGFVTYITAKTIRYSIDNTPDINGIDKEALRENLKKQDCVNGYRYASEFVRSLDIVMEMSGYDATYEYMFHKDGLQALVEVTNNFSPELSKIIKRQSMKTAANSKNLTSELSFFRSFFERMDIDKLNINNVEMNASLQSFLSLTKPFNQNEEVLDLLENLCPDLLKYQRFLTEIRYLSPDDRRNRIQECLPNDEIEWQIKEKPLEVINSITNGLKKQYERQDSKFNINRFGTTELYSVLICYNMLQKGIEQLDDGKIKEYLGYLAYGKKMENIVINSMKTYFERVKQERESGKDIRDILNGVISDKVEFVLEIAEISSGLNKENYMDGVTKIAETIKKFSYDRNNDFFELGYGTISGVMQKYYGEDKIYNIDDLSAFRNQMQSIFDLACMPDYIKENGCTIDKMFIKAITAVAKEDGNNFSRQMLGILELFSTGNLELGYATEDLEDFSAKVYTAFDDIKLSDSEDKTAFNNMFLHNFLVTDNLKATNVIERKGKVEHNHPSIYLSRVLDGILADCEFGSEKTINDDGVEISNFENIFQNPEKNIAKTLVRSQSFLEMFSTQMIGNLPKPKGENYSFYDIRGELLGKSNPTAVDIYYFDYSSYNDFVPFFIKKEAMEDVKQKVNDMNTPISLGSRMSDVIKSVTSFEMVGETEFAKSQTEKILEKVEAIDTSRISDFSKAQIALEILGTENEKSFCVEQLKGKSEFLEDMINGLKQYATSNPFNMQRAVERLKPFSENSRDVTRVLDFLNDEKVWDYSLMQEEPVLTEQTIDEIAKREAVQLCMPNAQNMLERLEQKKERAER